MIIHIHFKQAHSNQVHIIIHVHFPQATATVIKMVKKFVLWASNQLHWAHSVKCTYSHTISKLNLISTSDTFNWYYPLRVSVLHPTCPVCGPFFNHLQENFSLYSDALLHAGIIAITYLGPGWHGHIVTGLWDGSSKAWIPEGTQVFSFL